MTNGELGAAGIKLRLSGKETSPGSRGRRAKPHKSRGGKQMREIGLPIRGSRNAARESPAGGIEREPRVGEKKKKK